MSTQETLQLYLSEDRELTATDSALRQLLGATDQLRSWHVGGNLEGCWGAGQFTVDLLWEDGADSSVDFSNVPSFERADGVRYEGIDSGVRDATIQGGIWRTLMLQVREGVPLGEVATFEQELLGMPKYMQGIRNWRLGRVTHSGSRWTHVWQQEYSTIDDLMGEYLLHPYHWGWVDRRFDPEFPEVWVVDTHLCHAFCPLENSIIGRR